MNNNFLSKNLIFIITIFCYFFLIIYPVNAQSLETRIQEYPHWNYQLSLAKPEKELIFPSWFEGEWNVTSTLREQIAPLAPKFKTPGFDENQIYLNKEINFNVKFIPTILTPKNNNFIPNLSPKETIIIPDRIFNGLSIALAYLGEGNVQNVMINSNNPNEQITKFREENELISTVIGRGQETPSANDFITSEITRQFFRRGNSVYLNLVETTTQYHFINEKTIEGKQVTAIYLSPKDPDYFIAFNRPVALYYYTLTLVKK